MITRPWPCWLLFALTVLGSKFPTSKVAAAASSAGSASSKPPSEECTDAEPPMPFVKIDGEFVEREVSNTL